MIRPLGKRNRWLTKLFESTPETYAEKKQIMEQHGNRETYGHRIDKNDIIIGVSDNWYSFALENLGAQSCSPENIIGSSLWDHIRDPETRHLYEMILQKVREHHQQATFSFRCDSPEQRRFLKLTVIPLEDGSVDFESQTIKTELRKPVELLRSDVERSEETIRICSMCKKIAMSKTDWEELEFAVQKLKLFEKTRLPQFTHGICQSCYDETTAELKKLSNSK